MSHISSLALFLRRAAAFEKASSKRRLLPFSRERAAFFLSSDDVWTRAMSSASASTSSAFPQNRIPPGKGMMRDSDDAVVASERFRGRRRRPVCFVPTMRSSFSFSSVSSLDDDAASRESNFSQKANGYLETLGEKLETWADESSEEEVECEYSDGVLTISLGAQRGTYVLNKQAPNKQIWWSSPISGPHRFEEDGERWVDARRGEAKDCLDDLETKLTKEWGEIFKGKKELNL